MLRLATLSLVLACATSTTAEVDFRHDAGAAPQPWTERTFDAADDKFTFAIFSDLTGGERSGVFDLAVAQLNLLRPEFIINVGDLIEGDPNRATAERQWDAFDTRARKARAPVFYVGGNHDLLGKTLRSVWRERLGPRYYHFVYKSALFLVLDTEDHTPERVAEMASLRQAALTIAEEQGWDAFYKTEYYQLPENAAGNLSAEQSEYILKAIETNPDVRWTFLFMHKAPWRRDDAEGFSAIEAALADRPYTVFHGHEHAYRYEQRQGRDYIQLATTGGVFLPENGPAFDQLVLVTVDDKGVDIANLKLSGILDKTGKPPHRGDPPCLEAVDCPPE